MKRVFALALAAIAAILWAGASTAGGRDSGIAIADVCNPDPYGLKCWTPSGAEDPAQKARLEPFFRGADAPRLKLRYGRRDKLIVVRLWGDDLGPKGTSFAGLRVWDGEFLPVAIRVPKDPDDGTVEALMWYYPPPDLKTTPMQLLFARPEAGALIEPREGAEARLPGKIDVRINLVRPEGPGRWRLAYDAGGLAPHDVVAATPVGLDGAPIGYGASAGEGAWMLGVDPRNLAALRLRRLFPVGGAFPSVSLGPY